MLPLGAIHRRVPAVGVLDYPAEDPAVKRVKYPPPGLAVEP